MNAPRPWHPWLMAIFPPLFLLAQNAREARPIELVAPIAITLAATSLAWVGLSLILRSRLKGALVATILLGLFFTFATRHEAMESSLTALSVFWVLAKVTVPDFVLIALDLLLIMTIVAGLRRWKGEPVKLTRGLNLFASLLVATSLFKAVPSIGGAIKNSASGGIEARRTDAPVALARTTARRPDIYYILLDGFGREDVLKTEYQFNLMPFLGKLEKAGFFVAHHARANYCQTPLCLSSSLNFRYLDDPSLGHPARLDDLKDLIGNNSVARTLMPLGYKFVTFATGFDPTDRPATSEDHYSPFYSMSEFHRMLVDTTPLVNLLAGSATTNSYKLARARTLYTLDTLPAIAHDPSPTFTFAHVVCPHPPFIFGEHGEDVSPYHTFFNLTDGHTFALDAHTPQDYRDGYRRQVAFLVDRVGRIVDEILASSPEPPIILLQSDHGPGMHLNALSLEDTDLHERMNILNAYYFPGKKYESLYPGITPVNSFRAVLNAEFGAKLPLLPDRSYFSTWPEPFQFKDVTRCLDEDDARRESPDDESGNSPTRPNHGTTSCVGGTSGGSSGE